jgi:hypothetical protein
MGVRFLMQPNGKLAVFSEIVDNFTYANLAQEEALRVASADMDLGPDASRHKVANGLARGVDDHGGWNYCLKTIRAVHGEEACDAVVKEILEAEKPRKKRKRRA